MNSAFTSAFSIAWRVSCVRFCRWRRCWSPRHSVSSGRSSKRRSCRRARQSSSGRVSVRVLARDASPNCRRRALREYKPRSTLVVPAASAPAREVSGHRHPQPPADADLGGGLREGRGWDGANNLRLLVNLSGGSGERLKAGLEAIRASKYQDRMVLFANVDFRDVGPGFGAKAAAQLEQDIKAGARAEDLQGPRPEHPARPTARA